MTHLKTYINDVSLLLMYYKSFLSCYCLYHQLDKALPDKLIYLQSLRHMMTSHGNQQNKTTYRCSNTLLMLGWRRFIRFAAKVNLSSLKLAKIHFLAQQINLLHPNINHVYSIFTIYQFTHTTRVK
jgi:hypothetical protein